MKKLTFKSKMILSVSSMVVTILALIALFAFPFFEEHFRISINNHQKALVQSIAEEIDSKILSAQRHLAAISKTAAGKEITNPSVAQEFLLFHSDDLEIFGNGLYLYSQEGTIFASNPFQSDVIGLNLSFREYFATTKESRVSQISKPFISSQATGHRILMFTQPIFDPTGDLVAILGGSLDLESNNFLERILQLPIGHDGHLMLFDKKQKMVISPTSLDLNETDEDEINRHKLHEEIFKRGGDNSSILISEKSLTTLPWILTAIFPTEEAFKPFTDGKKYFTAIVFGAALFSIICVWLLMDRLTKPIATLTAYVYEASKDSKTPYPEIMEKEGEIGLLFKSFQHLINETNANKVAGQKHLYFLQNLIDSIPNPIFFKDPNALYLGGNKAFAEYIGIPITDIIGKSVYDIAPKHLADIYHKADLDLMKKKTIQTYESSVIYADNTVHDVIFYKKTFFNEDGSLGGLLGTIVDISDRKAIEVELHKSKAILNSVLNNSDNSFLALDAEKRVIYFNNRYLEMFPFTKDFLETNPTHEELVREGCRLNIYPTDQVEPLISSRAQTLDNCTGHTPIHSPRTDGKFYEGVANKLPDGGFLLSFRDITERKNIETQLKQAYDKAEEARDQLTTIVRSVADGLVVTDNANRIILINHIAGDLLNLSTSETLLKPVGEILKNSPLSEHFSNMINTPLTESGIHSDIELQTGDPNYPLIIQTRSTPMFNQTGIPTGAITTLTDVTHSRELDRMKNEFISTAAHELRTPLTSILGFTELLLNQKDFRLFSEEEQKDFLTEIYEKGEALEIIIDDLLDISRIQQGKLILIQKSFVNLPDLIKNMIRNVRYQTSKHQIKLELTDSQPVGLNIDRNKIVQVFENLISNAIKYSPEGGDIRITAGAQGELFQVSIEDEGIGMTPEQTDRIFDKFYRADASNTAIGGLGLGMSIVKTIIEAHGGKIWVESWYNEGTQVTFTLPLTEED